MDRDPILYPWIHGASWLLGNIVETLAFCYL
jgi:hypothetical protein